MFGTDDNDILMRLLLGDKAKDVPNFLGQGMQMPGPIVGFGGGTYDLEGKQVTPVRQNMEPPTPLAEQIGNVGNLPEQPQLPQEDEGAVTVDGWKPKKPTTLGTIADILLGAFGGPMIFHQKARRDNLQSAMDGFTQDPLNTIRRMARIPGMEERAMKLYNEYQDNKRADMAAGSLADSRRMKIMPRIGGLLNSISNAEDPAAAYSANLSRLRRLQEMAGDSEILPDTYDPTVVRGYIDMNIDPEDLIRMEALQRWRDTQKDLKTRALDQRDQTIAQGAVNEQGRNNRAAAAETGRNIRSKNVPATGGSRMIRDAQGNIVGKTSINGRTAILKAPDGGTQHFEVLPNGKLGRRIPDEIVQAAKKKGK